jgi:hypothetical protein
VRLSVRRLVCTARVVVSSSASANFFQSLCFDERVAQAALFVSKIKAIIRFTR